MGEVGQVYVTIGAKVAEALASLAQVKKELAGVAPIAGGAGASVQTFGDLLKKYAIGTAKEAASKIAALKAEQSRLTVAFQSGLIGLGDYQKATNRISQELKALEGTTQAVEVKTKSFADTCKDLGQQFKDFGKPLAVAGAAITGAFAIAIKKTADLGDEFKDLSQRTGIAVETLSGFKLAADKSGTSIAGFATGMRGLSRVMADAASGGKETQAAFASIGVSATDGAGNLRPLEEVMLDVADRFAKMPDGAEKSALAMKLFGKSGAELIPMLNMGRQGLEENAEQMRKFGIVTREEAEAGDAFNDAMTDLGAATSGLSRAITGTLLPALAKLVSGAADTIAQVSTWAREHKGLTTILSGGVLAIGAIATALGTLAFGIGTVMMQLPKFIDGFKTLKLLASKSFVFTFVLAGVAIVAAGVKKMIDDFKELREAGKTTAEALGAMAPKFNPFNNLSRESLGKFLADMDAARDKSINLKGAMILLGDAFRAIKAAVEQGTMTPILNLSEALKSLGIKTRTELTAELANAEAALKLLKGSVEATPGQVKALEDKIVALKEAMSGTKTETKSLAEQLGLTFRSDTEERIKKLNEALLMYRGKLTADKVDEIRAEIDTLSKSMKLNLAPAADTVAAHIDNALAKLEDLVLNTLRAINEEGAYTVDQLNSELDAIAANIKKKTDDIPGNTKPALDETRGMFDGLFNDIASGFGNTIQSWLEGATTFKDFMSGMWGDIKSAFFRVIGEMVAKWLVGLVQPLVTSAAATGASMTASLGGGLAAIGSGISALVTSLIGILPAMATAIASAATILAAAAPAILIVGAIGLGLYAAAKAIGSLIGGGGAGAGDGMGRVVERQDKQLAILQSLIDFCRNNIGPSLLEYGVNYMAKTMDAANQAVGWLDKIYGALKNMKSAASGAVITAPQMVMTHGSPTRPEYIIPSAQLNKMLASNARGGGPGQPINITIPVSATFHGRKMDEQIINVVVNGSQTGGLRRLAPKAIGA